MPQSHRDLRQQLCDALRDNKENVTEPLVDVDIPGGRHWRPYLFDHLSTCDAAVVLVNERVIREPEGWVDFEAKVLAWRAWIEPEALLLILVPVAPVTMERVRGHASWQSIAPGEFQMIPRGNAGLDPDDPAAVRAAISAVVDTLNGWRPARPEDGREPNLLLRRLSERLRDYGPRLADVAAAIGVPATPNPDAVRGRVARWLYERGPGGLQRLRELDVFGHGEAGQAEILEILSTSWINLAAAMGFRSACASAAGGGVLALNGEREFFTPDAYVRLVCCHRSAWPVIQVDDKAPVGEIIAQVRAALHERFKRSLAKRPPKGDQLDERLTEILENRIKALSPPEPVFVALSPSAACDGALVRGIRAAFRPLTVVLCLGVEPGGHVTFDNGTPYTLLRPEFGLDEEQEAWAAYDAQLSLLG